MHPKAIEAFKIVKKAHNEAYALISDLPDETKSCANLCELVDTAYAMKQIVLLVKDIENEAKRLEETAIQIACALWAMTSTTGEPIRTEYCTGSPDIKQMASIPNRNRNPELYEKFMDSLGVPRDLWAGEGEAFRPHWPGLVEYISERQRTGKPLPEGVDPSRMYPVYKLTCRPKKGVDE